MEQLNQQNEWPDEDRWPKFRPQGAVDFEKVRQGTRRATRRGYVGLVYADGNAMGRFVQKLDSVETCRAFSEIVDGAIRDACHVALTRVCTPEIEAIRAKRSKGPLPADILLLGGDDLLVLLPGDLALDFAMIAMETFAKLTGDRIEALTGPARAFFQSMQVQHLTISCGVAFAGATYPFYLLLDLAEELLRSAKKAGSRDPSVKEHYAPSYLDFHLVVGPQGTDLAAVREREYLVGSQSQRTLRPYSADQLATSKKCAEALQHAELPRSKLQNLWIAALEPRVPRAEARCRELFSRLREAPGRGERRALWQALQQLGMGDRFPWSPHGNRTATALADLVEAVDLFPHEVTA